MRKEIKAYIAGIIDGEGTITLTRLHKNQTHYPVVYVSNTNLELVNWLKRKMKLGLIKKKSRKSIKHNQAYEWNVRGDKAISFLKKIQPYLIIKKEHAKLIIDNYKEFTPRNGRYTEEQKMKKKWLVDKIRYLNTR